MPLTLAKSGLLSRVTRSDIVQNGIRKLDLDYSFAEQSQDNGNLVQRILDFGSRAVGFLWNAVRGIKITATAIYGWLVARVTEISQFDWNATDAELEATIRQRNIGLAGIWGGSAGTILGQLAPIAIGAGIALFIPVIGGPALALAVVASATPEALEEIFASIRTALGATVSTAARNTITSGYINLRKLIKSVPQETLKKIVGEKLANWIKNTWGSESAPRLSFADTLENKIEEIENPYLKAFAEEAADEFFDNFIESGFIVAQSLDQAIAEARAAQVKNKGQQRAVLIQPDDRTPEMALTVFGQEIDVRNAVQTTINSYRQIASKDVGQIVGQPVEDWYKGRPQRRKMTVVFKELEKPPYYRRGGYVQSATYTIPDPRPNLSWERIKLACKPYNWGKFRCTANLDNGRQMGVYGASPVEAEEKLRDLLSLSTAEIVTLSITEEKDRNPKLRKSATRLYPATGIALVRRPSLDTVGRTDLEGNTWDEDHVRFDLWTDTEPEEFADVRFGFGEDAN